MFSMKRILVLLLLAAVVYCFWPRTPSLLAYAPARMAELQREAERKASSKNWFGHGFTEFQIFLNQYHFPPVAAVKVAIDQSRAVSVFRTGADPTDKETAVKPLTLAYAEIKRQTAGSFDPAAVATQQVRVWSLLEEKNFAEAAKVLAGQLAAVHGGAAANYLPVARDFVDAATAAQNGKSAEANTAMAKAWSGLQKVARK